MVCQGFAGENYARRASFSMGKRRSRLTLTGRRRQATFAGVFVLIHNNTMIIRILLIFIKMFMENSTIPNKSFYSKCKES